MAKRKFSGNLYFIDSGETATLTGGKYFHTLVNGSHAIAAGLTVEGGGIFEYLAADSGTDTHLNANGIVLGASHAAGFYEAIGTQGVVIDVAPNQIICGRFTKVTLGSTNSEIHAYTG